MSITEAEMRRLVTGVKTKNLDELDAVMDTRVATKSPDPIKRNIYNFIAACALGNRHVVATYLLLRDFDHEVLYSGLLTAVLHDGVDVVKVLIENCKLDPNFNNGLPLLDIAAHQGATDVLEYFLSLPQIDVNHTSSSDLYINETALYAAVLGGKHDSIRILLEAGANPYILRIQVRKPTKPEHYESLSKFLGVVVTPENYDKYHLMDKPMSAYDEMRNISQRNGENDEIYKIFKEWEAKVDASVIQRLKREANNFKNNKAPVLQASPSLTVPKFSSVDFNGASAFMTRYKDSLADSSLKQLHPLATAAMNGESFLSIVTCYLIKREFDLAVLYQAIYLAAWFVSEKSIETIINKCHSDLDADTMIKVLEQGRADSERYKGQVANTRKNKTAQQIDAVAQMKRQLSLLMKDLAEKHEHSSDEERLSPPGSNSPGHSSDSDKEPKSAGSDGSNNSPPSSPEKSPALPVVQQPPQFVIPPGNEPLDHAFLATSNQKERNALYDTGRVKLNCKCAKCDRNALQVCLQHQRDLYVAKYMLYHSQFPADINSVNNRGRTILHLVVDFKSCSKDSIQEIIYKFADKNPNVNAVDEDGNTALHLACTKEYAYVGEVVAELLKGGANPNIRNKQGLTAIQCAEANCKNPERKKAIMEAFKPVTKDQPPPLPPVHVMSLRPPPASNYDELRRQAENKKASKNTGKNHVTQEEKEKCCVM